MVFRESVFQVSISIFGQKIDPINQDIPSKLYIQANVLSIDAANQNFLDGLSTFSLKINRFGDQTFDEFIQV